MIPGKLEELIWKGEASYNTWTIGTSSAGLLVPEDHTIIIFAIDFFPYADSDSTGLAPASGPEWRDRMNKVILLQDQNKRYTFLARSYFQVQSGIQGDAHTFHCYCPFTENLTLSLVNITSISNWTITSGPAPQDSKGKPAPLGYGTIAGNHENAPLTVEFGNTDAGEMRPYKGTRPTNPLSAANFQIGADPSTTGVDPNANFNNVGNMQFPFITVHYVDINKKLTKLFR